MWVGVSERWQQAHTWHSIFPARPPGILGSTWIPYAGGRLKFTSSLSSMNSSLHKHLFSFPRIFHFFAYKNNIHAESRECSSVRKNINIIQTLHPTELRHARTTHAAQCTAYAGGGLKHKSIPSLMNSSLHRYLLLCPPSNLPFDRVRKPRACRK